MVVGYTYNPNTLLVIIRGVPITGFADGSTINLTPNNDKYNTTYGTTGLFIRSLQVNDGGVLTFSLMPNSPSNTFLSSLLLEDALAQTAIVPFAIKARTGAIPDIASGFGWVKKVVDLNYSIGGDAPMREWTFEAAKYTQTVGGGTLPLGVV